VFITDVKAQKETIVYLPNESFSITLKDRHIGIDEFSDNINRMLGLNTAYNFVLLRSDLDKYGMLHQRYLVMLSEIKLDGNQLIVHSKDGIISSINGEIINVPAPLDPELNISSIENIISEKFPDLTLNSLPELTYVRLEEQIILCYMTTLQFSLFKSRTIYIDSTTGEIVRDVTNNHNAKANSMLSGTVNVNTTFENDNYLLQDTVKNIFIVDANNQYIFSDEAVIPSDDDDKWLDNTFLKRINVYGVFADFNVGLGDLEFYPDLYFRLYYDGEYTGYQSSVMDDVSSSESISLNWPVNLPDQYSIKVYDEDPINDDFLFEFYFFSRSFDLPYFDSSDGSLLLSFSNNDNAAIDAFWGLSNAHYFYEIFGWMGPDNQNGEVMSVVNLHDDYFTNENGDVNQCNASATTIDDVNVIFHGDGSTSPNVSPFVSQDIVGHEYTHLVINHSSDLLYYGESGAINEALSDISAELIERIAYATDSFFYYSDSYPYTNYFQTNSPYEIYDWLVGEDVFHNGGYIRNMSNPKIAGQPDTYLGEYWSMYDDDNNGVHTNSGVLNYWYYLLLEGGSGINDNGYSYNVDPVESIGAFFIPFSSMLYYMTPNTNYFMAKDISLQICEDLSDIIPQSDYLKILDAWAAVGLGGECETGYSNILVLHDSYGDGWQGNSLELEIDLLNEESVDLSFTIEDGYSEIYCLPSESDVCVYFSWEEGSWQSECSWQLFDSTGVVIAGGVAGIVPESLNCLPGCSDVFACNYDQLVNSDDGSCEYAIEYYDCSGNCIDLDLDDVCDFEEIFGCIDNSACNFNELATEDDESCIFSEQFYDCVGNCLIDSDLDGVCDELEIIGCLDNDACNFESNATDSGDCIYPQIYLNCDNDCINDVDSDGVCDELEVVGCTNVEACNYDMFATDEDESICEFLQFELIFLSNSFIVSSTDDIESAIYTWYLNGVVLPQFTENFIVAEENGTYSLAIYDPTNNCESIEGVDVYGVGLNDNNLFKLELKPNPSKDYTQLSFNYSYNSPLEITITNVIGEKVSVIDKIDFNKGFNEINIKTDHLEAGSYFINLVADGISQTKILSVVR
jgi:Zn-dependent metalloprotease